VVRDVGGYDEPLSTGGLDWREGVEKVDLAKGRYEVYHFQYFLKFLPSIKSDYFGLVFLILPSKLN
jgi:hypothetical protein